MLAVGDYPYLEQFGVAVEVFVHFAVAQTAPGAHYLDHAAPDGFAVPHAVAVGQRAAQGDRDDFHVAVGMEAESGAGSDTVVVEYAQGAEMDPFGIVVVGEAEGVVGLEPPVVEKSPGRSFVQYGFHGCV